MFKSSRLAVLLAAAEARLETERQLHAEQLDALRAQASRYEDMLIRVVDAALARHLMHTAELQPITPVVARPPQRLDHAEPEPPGAVLASRGMNLMREIHFGGLDENAALLAIAKREEALIAAEEALIRANSAVDPDGD